MIMRLCVVFFFKQKTAYEMRISDWSSDVCSSDLVKVERRDVLAERKDEAAAKVTFREAARQYHAENKAAWKSAVYARQWLASLENHAFTKLGDIPTGGIGDRKSTRLNSSH